MFGANVPGWPYPGQAYAGVSGPSTQTVTVGGVSSAQTFGAVTIAGGPAPQARAVTGVASAQSFGAVTTSITRTPQTRAVSGVASAQSFGTLRFRLYRPTGGVSSAQQFGVVTTFTGSPQTVQVPGLQSFYATITSITGSVISGDGHRVGSYSVGQFGTPTLKAMKPVVPGLGSAQAFGTPKLNIRFTVLGLGSAQQFGGADAFIVWLHSLLCTDLDLDLATEAERVLAAAGETVVELQPLVCQ